MANVTYKTVINNAIKGFNDIQNKLNSIGSRYGNASTAYGSLSAIAAASTDTPLSITNLLRADAFRAGSITVTSGSVTTAPSAKAGLSNSTNTFPALLDLANTGVVSSVSGTAGTDYWAITPIISQSSSGTVSGASASVGTSGYMAGNATISDGDEVTVGVSTNNGTTIYVKRLPSGSNSIGGRNNGVYPISYVTSTGGYLPKDSSVSAGSLAEGVVSLSSGGATKATASAGLRANDGDLPKLVDGTKTGVVSSKPTGDAGTDYWVLKPTLSTSNGSVAGASASITTDGYIKSGTTTISDSSNVSVGVTENVANPIYINKASATLGGNASADLDMKAGTASYIAYHSDKANTGVVSTKPTTGDSGTDYWILTPTVSGSATNTATATLTAGYLPKGASAGGSVGVEEGTVTSYYLKKATLDGTGGALSGTMSVSSSGSYDEPSTINCSVSTSSTDTRGVIFTPSFSTSASGSIDVTRADVKYTAVGGYQPKITTATTILTSDSKSFTGSGSSSNNTKAYYIRSITVGVSNYFPVTLTGTTALNTDNKLDVTNGAFRHVEVQNAANGRVTITGMTNSGATAKIDKWLISRDSSSNLTFTYTNS